MSNDHQPRLGSISHVMLGVRDLTLATAFYRDKLGMLVAFESPEFTFLQGGAVTLCLSQPLAQASQQLVGATEVVFGVESVQAAHQALQSRGVPFLNEPRLVAPEQWAANFTDPDGHRLSIFGPP